MTIDERKKQGLPEKVWSVLLQLSGNTGVDTAENMAVCRGYSYDLNEQVDEAIWHDVTGFAAEKGMNMVFISLGNAIEYATHPELAVKNAWKPEKLRAELARLRSMGITPIPKLNFSSSHDIWLGEYERMLSTKIYYKVCREIIHEVIDIFDNPPLFHLGLDEENAYTPEFLGFQYGCFRQFDLLYHDMNYLFDCVREKGVRPMIWFSLGGKHHRDEVLEHIGKDVVLNPYKYDKYVFASHTKYKWNSAYVPDEIRNEPQKIKDLADAGYDIIICGSTWDTVYNIQQMLEYCEANIPPEKNLGYMVVPWKLCLPEFEYAAKNDIHLLSHYSSKFGLR